ncbi:MAG: hypothetical protein AAFW59_10990, partial [Pseudomonadota bacterium]
MRIHPDLTEIGQRTGFPEPPDSPRATDRFRDGLAGEDADLREGGPQQAVRRARAARGARRAA